MLTESSTPNLCASENPQKKYVYLEQKKIREILPDIQIISRAEENLT